MSAIAGLIRLDGGAADAADLSAMRSALAQRGPDGSATWNNAEVGLVHLLHRTIAETDVQPLVHGPLAITADVRLDNRADLTRDLRQPATATDEELVLAAYQRWGECCPDRLLGDFAFAIWDGRQRRLFCARDHFGVRQFFYRREPGRFSFATEIKGLLALPGTSRQIDLDAVAAYSTGGFGHALTLYRGVLRLPAAHSLTVTANGERLSRYWTPESAPPLNLASDADYASAFRAIFAEAVGARLRSTGRIGATLSGGLDSSSVTCMARDILAGAGRAPLASFSGRYRLSPECDEGPYIEAVRAQGGLAFHDVEPEGWSPLTDWEDGADGNDEPLLNPQMALHWAVYEAARRERVDVVLDGFPGDVAASHGAGRLTELAGAGHLLAAWTEVRALSRASGKPLSSLMRAHIVGPLTPAVLRRALRRRGPTSPPRTERKSQLTELASPLYPFALGILDRAAARHRLEPRYPYLDRRLVEFCVGLPAAQKLREGLTRSVVRRGLAGILPAFIAERGDKMNLGPAFVQALARGGNPSPANTSAPWAALYLESWQARRVRALPAPQEIEFVPA